MATTLTDARSLVRQFARSAGSSSAFENADVDNAIKLAGNLFVRETRIVVSKTTVTLTADADTVSFSDLTGFRPELLQRARVTVSANYTDYAARRGVRKVGYDDVLRMRGECDRTGVPEYIGFSATAAAEVYPTPQYAGTLTVWWTPPFTTFTSGTASPGDVTLNVPDDLAAEMLVLGAANVLQLTDPEAVNTALRTGAFAEFVRSCRGRGSIGGSAMTRELED